MIVASIVTVTLLAVLQQLLLWVIASGGYCISSTFERFLSQYSKRIDIFRSTYPRLRALLPVLEPEPVPELPLLAASTRALPLTAMVDVQPSGGGLAPLGTFGLGTRFPETVAETAADC